MTMENENELSGTEVSSEPSSESADSLDSGSKEAQASKESSNEQEKYVPYDRFKELVEQKNEFAKQFEQTQRQLQDLQARINNPASSPQQQQVAENKVLDILKKAGVEPEFIKWVEETDKATRQELKELREWRQGMDRTSAQKTVQSSLENLYTEHKVPKEVRSMYKAMIAQKAQENPRLQNEDLPKVFKEVHESFGKYLESQKRDALGQYAKGKAKDANVPQTAAKGQAPKKTGKAEYSTDFEEAKAQLVKRTMEQLRASRDT